MSDNRSTATDEPRLRPLEPEHPMLLEGGMTPGDTALMARCQLEELLFLGVSPHKLEAMSHSPVYQGLFAARATLGSDAFNAILEETVRRVGTHRATVIETTPTEFPVEFQPISRELTSGRKEQDDARSL